MQAAHGRLGKAQAVLELEGRGKRLKAMHAQIVGRRCRMVAALGAIFSIGPLTGVHSTCMSPGRAGLQVGRRCPCSAACC